MELEVKAKPYVGRYPFVPLEEMTTREWGWITEHTGYMPLQVEDALAGGDPRLVTMLAVVALARAGKVRPAGVQHSRLHHGLSGGGRCRPSSAGDRRELALFWGKFEHWFGQPGARPERHWNPALGFFSVAPGEVGDLTPAQLVGCVEMFQAMHGAG
jgi:hypothetical protein